MHKRIQKSKGANYHAEVPLKIELSEGDYTLAIEGRADGIEITCDGERQLDFSDNFNHLTVEDWSWIMPGTRDFASALTGRQ